MISNTSKKNLNIDLSQLFTDGFKTRILKKSVIIQKELYTILRVNRLKGDGSRGKGTKVHDKVRRQQHDITFNKHLSSNFLFLYVWFIP